MPFTHPLLKSKNRQPKQHKFPRGSETGRLLRSQAAMSWQNSRISQITRYRYILQSPTIQVFTPLPPSSSPYIRIISPDAIITSTQQTAASIYARGSQRKSFLLEAMRTLSTAQLRSWPSMMISPFLVGDSGAPHVITAGARQNLRKAAHVYIKTLKKKDLNYAVAALLHNLAMLWLR